MSPAHLNAAPGVRVGPGPRLPAGQRQRCVPHQLFRDSSALGTAPACKIASTQNRTDEAVLIGAGVSYGMLALQVRYHIGVNNLTNTAGVTEKSKGLLVLACADSVNRRAPSASKDRCAHGPGGRPSVAAESWCALSRTLRTAAAPLAGAHPDP